MILFIGIRGYSEFIRIFSKISNYNAKKTNFPARKFRKANGHHLSLKTMHSRTSSRANTDSLYNPEWQSSVRSVLSQINDHLEGKPLGRVYGKSNVSPIANRNGDILQGDYNSGFLSTFSSLEHDFSHMKRESTRSFITSQSM